MQKRLFLLFFPLMFIPALLVMLVGWQTSERQLEILDSPGLQRSLDSSLELARVVLAERKGATQQLADSLSCASATGLGQGAGGGGTRLPGVVWWSWPKQAPGNSAARSPSEGVIQGIERNPARLFQGFPASPRVEPVRLNTPSGSYIIALARLNGAPKRWLVVAQPLAPRLAADLDAVKKGGAGVRQLRLYYRRLMNTRGLLVLGGLAVLLCAVSLWLSANLSRRLAQPLQKLVVGTEKVATGDLNYRVEIEAPDELGLLVEAFNRMTSRLRQSQTDLQRAERVAAWQGVARRLAHEIKNPLTPITLAMHRIGKQSTNATVVDCVATVLEEAANLEHLANEFSLYAELPEPVRRPLSRDDLREMLAGQAQFYLARTRVRYEWVGWQCDFTVLVDAGQLRQVLSNLIKNGTEAMNGDGVLTFAVELRAGPDRPLSGRIDSAPDDTSAWVVLRIEDTGPGLSADPERVFEPYVTSKPGGTGLGLAIARRMVSDNGGRLWAESSGMGATFVMELPADKNCGVANMPPEKG